MKYYFAHLGHNTALKNNLEKSLYTLLNQENRKLIKESMFDAYKENLKYKIGILNKENTRCKPIEVHFTRLFEDKRVALHTGTGISFNYYLSQDLLWKTFP